MNEGGRENEPIEEKNLSVEVIEERDIGPESPAEEDFCRQVRAGFGVRRAAWSTGVPLRRARELAEASIADAQSELAALHSALIDATPEAVEVLRELSTSAICEPVRCRAAEAILKLRLSVAQKKLTVTKTSEDLGQRTLEIWDFA